jgi:hypothetical protein
LPRPAAPEGLGQGCDCAAHLFSTMDGNIRTTLMTTVIDRLMTASLPELLIAVLPTSSCGTGRTPPTVTAFGIIAGIAVILMCLGEGRS